MTDKTAREEILTLDRMLAKLTERVAVLEESRNTPKAAEAAKPMDALGNVLQALLDYMKADCIEITERNMLTGEVKTREELVKREPEKKK